MSLIASGRISKVHEGRAPTHVAVRLDRDAGAIDRAELDAARVDPAGLRLDLQRPASGLDGELGCRPGVDPQRHHARVGTRSGIDLQAAAKEGGGADDEQLHRPAVDEPVVGAHLDLRTSPQVRDGARHRGGPAREPARTGIGVASRHQRVPAGAGEQGQAPAHLDQVDRAGVRAHEHIDDVLRRGWKAQQVASGVAEAGRQVAQGEPLAAGRHVVRDAERSVATGDHRRPVTVDPLGQPGGDLVDVAAGDDVEIGVERAAGKIHRAPDVVGPGAASPLVEEDGRARAHYGRAARISATCSSLPVRK